MRVMIFGGGGMMGHVLFRTLLAEGVDVYATTRSAKSSSDRVIVGVDAVDMDGLTIAAARVRPDVAINCIGIVKQRPEGKDPLRSILINALFPHRLASICAAMQTRLIHISTDCVFSGRKGRYVETDVPDAEDLYGRTKFLGEVTSGTALTLRTSIIGLEQGTANGVVEWFLSHRDGRVRGFTHAMFSGLTTIELSRIIARLLSRPEMRGLYHVAADPISKYGLLLLLRDAFGRSVEIDPDPSLILDRTLDGSRFETAMSYRAPDWESMIREMAETSKQFHPKENFSVS